MRQNLLSCFSWHGGNSAREQRNALHGLTVQLLSQDFFSPPFTRAVFLSTQIGVQWDELRFVC